MTLLIPHPPPSMHQDAHEFLIYLLNSVSETLSRQGSRKGGERGGAAAAPGFTRLPAVLPESGKALVVQSLARDAGIPQDGVVRGGEAGNKESTWVQDIFEGRLVNLTRCLCCESGASGGGGGERGAMFA